MTHVSRITGGLEEVLVVGNATQLTVRGQAFEVSEELAAQLLNDGTGRWEEVE